MRFADDAIVLCSRESDARRVMAVLPKRFDKYGLTLHPEKTRVIPFRRPPFGSRQSDRKGEPGSFQPVGIYPLLGTVAGRKLGGKTQDSFGEIESGSQAD